jgi:hypothetical protein
MGGSADTKKTIEKSPALSRCDMMGAAAAVAAFSFVPRHVLGAAGQSSANRPEAENLITKFYRAGWDIK